MKFFTYIFKNLLIETSQLIYIVTITAAIASSVYVGWMEYSGMLKHTFKTNYSQSAKHDIKSSEIKLIVIN